MIKHMFQLWGHVCCYLIYVYLILMYSLSIAQVTDFVFPPCTFLLHLKVIYTAVFMSSLCGVGVRVNNFSETTRPRDMLFFLKDTLSIEDEKLFKACKSVCSSVC